MGRMGSTTSVRAREMRRVLADWQRSGLTLRQAGMKSIKSRIARRPRDTVIPSSTSATRTNNVMMRAVKNGEIPAAAMIAMLMDNSMVIRRAAAFSAASLKIGQPPIKTPSTPIRLTLGKGSHTWNQTAAAASKSVCGEARRELCTYRPI